MGNKCTVFMIDNFDSFTFNLVDSFKKLDAQVFVYRNNTPLSFLLDKIQNTQGPKCLVLSPGPGNPKQAGISLELVKLLHRTLPILGICLGHQVIGEALGAKIATDSYPFHGKASKINHDHSTLFNYLPSPMDVGRYHSLYVKDLPQTLIPIAFAQEMIMAIQVKDYPVYGLQFHPESILTPLGEQLLMNFMQIVHAQTQRGVLS